MRMLRGALTFLAIVAVFVVVECKKEQNENVTTGTTGTGISAGATDTAGTAATPTAQTTYSTMETAGGLFRAATVTCSDAPSGQKTCNSDPCIVHIEFKSTDTSVSAEQNKVWVSDGQTVRWKGREDGNDSKRVSLSELNFANKLKAAKCDTGDCIKVVSDARPCVPYKYTVLFNHNGKPGHLDPDVEVGSTTGTSTSGTAGVQ